MTVTLALLPALLVWAGALLYLVPLPRAERYRNFIPLLALAASAVALGALARTMPNPVELFEPSAILPGLTLALQWNGAAAPFGLFMLALLAARLMASHGQDARAFVVGLLAVAGGALLFLAADNFTTVAAAWLAVELGLLATPDPDVETRARVTTALAWNLAALVLWLGAAMMLANSGSSLRLQETTWSELPALLVFVAVWIRSGLYPAHAAAPSDVPGAAVRMGIPLLLGGYLMTRFLAANQGAMAFADGMSVLVALSLGLSALVTVSQWHGGNAFVWALRACGASLLLLPFIGAAADLSAVSVWLTLGAFGLAVWLSIAWSWRSQLARVPLTMLVWGIVLAMAAALPLMPAFLGRVGLLTNAYAAGMAWWLLLVASAALYLIPLWREIFASRDIAPRAPTRFEYAALGCGLFPALALLVAPQVFLAPFGAQTLNGATAEWNLLTRAPNFNALAFTVAGLVVPLLFALELARRRARGASFLPASLAEFLDLSALGRALDRVYRFLRALTLSGLALLEQPPVAWLFFLAIWAAVWITSLAR